MELVMREIVLRDINSDLKEEVFSVRHDIFFNERQFFTDGTVKAEKFDILIKSLRESSMLVLLSMILEDVNKQTNKLNLPSQSVTKAQFVKVEIKEGK